MKHFCLLLLIVVSSVFSASSFATNNPLLLSPQTGSILNANAPLTISAKANDANATRLFVKVLKNDPRTLVYENSHFVTTPDTPVQFSVPQGTLSGQQQYLIELKAINASQQLIGQQYFTIFTDNQATATLPRLISPAPGSMINLCNGISFERYITFAVNANNPVARAVEMRFNDSNQQNPYVIALADAEAAMKDVTTSVQASSLMTGTNSVQLTTKDGAGNIIGQQTFTLYAKADTKTPVLVFPTANATNVPLQPDIQIRTEGTCRGINIIHYELDRYPADWQGSDYQATHTGNLSWQPTTLSPQTKYQIRVTYDLLGEKGNVGSTRTQGSFTTAGLPATGPVLLQPAPNSTLDICSKLEGYYPIILNNRVIFNANDPLARQLSYKLFLNDPRQLITEYVAGFENATHATENVSIPISGIVPKQQYLVELKTLDADGNMLKQSYFTFFTSDKGSEAVSPQLIGPVAGATGVSLTPTISITPYTSCGNLTGVTYQISPYPMENYGPSSDGYQTASFGNTNYSWTVPKALKPNTRYEVRAFYTTDSQIAPQPIKEVTFTTGVASDTEPKPFIVSPAPDSPLVMCDLGAFVSITVNANNPKARKIIISGIGAIDSSPDNSIVLDAQQSMSPVGAAFRIGYPTFQPGEVRMRELKLTTLDASGYILAESVYNVPTTVPNRKAPDFLSLANGESGISTKPVIVMGNYPNNSCERVGFLSYEIDRYPADWAGSDYIIENVSSETAQWQPATELLPDTKYEIRVNFYFAGIATSSSVVSSFTTGSSSARAAAAAMSSELESKSVVSPNPFASEVSIQLHSGYQKATVTVISQQGQVVFSKESKGGESVQFKGAALDSGLYLVRISDGNGINEQFKLIKQ